MATGVRTGVGKYSFCKLQEQLRQLFYSLEALGFAGTLLGIGDDGESGRSGFALKKIGPDGK